MKRSNLSKKSLTLMLIAVLILTCAVYVTNQKTSSETSQSTTIDGASYSEPLSALEEEIQETTNTTQTSQSSNTKSLTNQETRGTQENVESPILQNGNVTDYYDSGWLDISSMAGQYINVTHNLDSNNLAIQMERKAKPNGEITQSYGLNYLFGWNRTYLNGFAQAVIQTSDEGYAMTGGYYGDVCLIKTDSLGVIEWEKLLCLNYSDNGQAIIQTSDKGYAITGFTYQSETNNSDVLLVKTDCNGNIEWHKHYGGPKEDQGYSLIQSKDDGYVVAGTSNSYGHSIDFYLLKVDKKGNMQWNKTFGWQNIDAAFSIIQTMDDGYAIAGLTDGPSGGSDSWLIKTDSNGAMQWNRIYGTKRTVENIEQVIQASDGGYVLAGLYGPPENGPSDFLLIKTDVNGFVEWERTFGGSNDDMAKDVVQTSDNGYAIVGTTKSFGAGYSDVWLVKVDSNGKMQWNQTFGGVEEDYGFSLVQNKDESLMICGTTNSSVGGSFRMWLIKTGIKSGLVISSYDTNTITLYRDETDTSSNWIRVKVNKID